VSELTGGLSNRRLHRLTGSGPLTVAVVRLVRPGDASFFAAWSERMAGVVRSFPGCLGCAPLSSADGLEFHMVFRFVDAEALRAWERSFERSALLAEIDDTVLEERVTTLPSAAFTSTLASVRPSRPLPLRVLVDVLWIFPVAFFWSSVLAPWFVGLPLPVATLLSAGVITFLAEFLLAPMRRRLRSRLGLPVDRVVRS
jgi:antibiotic biosynthesis monooxygenase (ABM) superfamily enzyme